MTFTNCEIEIVFVFHMRYLIIQYKHIHNTHIKGAPVKSAVVPIKSNRQLLLQFHSEYTSITDELENVCQMITSPTSSLNRDSNEKSCSNAEFAAMLEKKHLHECEESDYLMLSKLFQNRDSINESDDAFADVRHYRFYISLFLLLLLLFKNEKKIILFPLCLSIKSTLTLWGWNILTFWLLKTAARFSLVMTLLFTD